MNSKCFLIICCFIFFLSTEISYAAPLIYRLQQAKAMKQKRAQEQYQQEYPQQGGQGQGEGTTAPQTYQETVEQRNQALARAILDAHNPSISSNITAAVDQTPQNIPSATSTEVKDVVDLSEVWKKLDHKSTVWTLLIDDQAKVLTVSEYIDRFHKQGVRISEPPLHYVQMMDQVVAGNQQMLQRPFGELVQILAIIDYDFDNGMDKDALARKVLGEAAFEANKKRFSQ